MPCRTWRSGLCCRHRSTQSVCVRTTCSFASPYVRLLPCPRLLRSPGTALHRLNDAGHPPHLCASKQVCWGNVCNAHAPAPRTSAPCAAACRHQRVDRLQVRLPDHVGPRGTARPGALHSGLGIQGAPCCRHTTPWTSVRQHRSCAACQTHRLLAAACHHDELIAR